MHGFWLLVSAAVLVIALGFAVQQAAEAG